MATVYPPGTVLMPCGDPTALRLVSSEPSFPDAATGIYLAIAGGMPLICHRNAATPLIQDFFREAGIHPGSNIASYETREEAVAIAGDFVRRGWKLAYTYPLPPELASGRGLLVRMSLYHWLNDKANQNKLVDARYLPRHEMSPPESAPRLLDYLPDRAVFVKVCRKGVSGGGSDVYFCRRGSDRRAALEWIRTRGPSLTAVRVEQAMEIPVCWCVNVGVSGSKARSIGAAIQLFSAPARQIGSRINIGDPPPREVIDIATSIADRARSLGYRGIAGIDIGVSGSGRPFVFDLNFRPAACTPQVLLHEAAVTRAGASMSQSWKGVVEGGLEPALERLRGISGRGAFVPARLYDGQPGAAGKSVISGFVVGRRLAEIQAVENEINHALRDLPAQVSHCSRATPSFTPTEPTEEAPTSE